MSEDVARMNERAERKSEQWNGGWRTGETCAHFAGICRPLYDVLIPGATIIVTDAAASRKANNNLTPR
jgi:uncharacterized protein with von Willebrand factor type A (vWA) domain